MAASDAAFIAKFKSNALLGVTGMSQIDKVYYSFELNGCKYIMLGSEGQSTLSDVDHAHISQTQINWFQNEVAAAKSGEPESAGLRIPASAFEKIPYRPWKNGIL